MIWQRSAFSGRAPCHVFKNRALQIGGEKAGTRHQNRQFQTDLPALRRGTLSEDTTRLRKALCQDGDEMNTHFYQGKDFSLGQVIDLAETLPFLAERRVMFFKDTGLFKPVGKSWQNIWQAPMTPPFVNHGE